MRRLAWLFLAMLTLAAPHAGAQTRAPLPVVASFSILGDFLREVGGDAVRVSVLVGPDGDAHVYEPTPADARKVSEAKLVFVNGLGFEGWLDRLVAAADAKSRVLVASAGITPRKLDGGVDPHAWQDIANARRYVENIRDALKSADPERAALYEEKSAAYLTTLEALDKEVASAIAAIPSQRRRVVSTHDAFGYFSARYGLEFIAPQGVSTEAEPSARDIARIIDSARREKVTAIFLENISDPRLAQRLAKESGVTLGGELYSDALSKPDGPAASYVAMMRHNVGEVAKALGH